MSLYNSAKEAVVEYAVLSVLGVIGLLGFILWQAVPSTFWEGISNAIDKKVLWSLIGLLLLIVVGESIYILQSYLRARTILRHYGGVLWNSNCELFCPKDETPIYQKGLTFDEDNPTAKRVEILQCPKCDSSYIFKNSEGTLITIAEAKKGFLTNESLKIKGSIQPPEIEEGFDDTTIKVLQGFAGTTSPALCVQHFTGLLKQGVKPVRISHSLDILNKKGYLSRSHLRYEGNNTAYELTEQGREYIVKNNIA